MYDDPSMSDPAEDYAYYPPPCEEGAVGYDEIMVKVFEGRWVALIDLPDRGAIYRTDLAVVPGAKLVTAPSNERTKIQATCVAALGRRVHAALASD